MRSGFNLNIHLYLIKPSAITNDFNQQINPRILQGQAGHKKIVTTLLYDHIRGFIAKKYFNKIQTINIKQMNTEDKARIRLDKLRTVKKDLKTFKTGIDVLLTKKRKGDEIGYV